jgi:arylsulfatase A-like enzyme
MQFHRKNWWNSRGLKPLQRLVKPFTVILTLCVSTGIAAAPKPNFVLVLMDNFGYGEVGAYGGGVRRGAPTPRIDSLAHEGLKLTNFNTEPVCTPSRAALMTGRFPIRSGTYGLANGANGGLVQWEVTLAEMLHDAGYVSAAFGKWHLGTRAGRFPTNQGFDEWYGIPRSNDESLWFGSIGYNPQEVLPEPVLEGHRGDLSRQVAVYDRDMRSRFDGEITRRGIEFIRREARAKQPFFAYLAMTTGHIPTIPSPEWRGRTGNGPWADVLAQLDSYIGELLDAVHAAGIENNTIFIFTADNGAEPWSNHGENRGWPGPWRGSYGTAMEGGLRVPFLIRWPGKVPAQSESDEIVHLVDVFPTFARLAGGKVPTDRAIDGVDQTDFLLGKQRQSNRDFFPIYDWNGQVMAVKWRHWKAHFYEKVYLNDPPVQRSQLVNLLVDPMEERSEDYEYGWVWLEIEKRLAEFQASLTKYPPIKPDTPDPYQPSGY